MEYKLWEGKFSGWKRLFSWLCQKVKDHFTLLERRKKVITAWLRRRCEVAAPSDWIWNNKLNKDTFYQIL